MKIYLLLAIVLISLSFYGMGCSSDITGNGGGQVDTSSFKFPVNNGSSWRYNKQVYFYNLRPDTISGFTRDTARGTGTITILYDTVINSIPVKCFGEVYTETYNGHTTTSYSSNYFASTDSGLINYGYRGEGGTAFPYKQGKGIKFRYNGIVYNNMRDIALSFDGDFFSRGSYGFSDTLTIENPPVRSIKYPISSGVSWIFKNTQGVHINKKYLGFENIQVPAGIFRSVKTQREWQDMNDMVLYDYLTPYGQMKRDYTIKDIIIMNEMGEILGHADYKIYAEVTSYHIVTP